MLLYCRSGVRALPQTFNPSFPQAESRKYRASGRNHHWKLITINIPTVFMLLLFSSFFFFSFFQCSVMESTLQNWNNLYHPHIYQCLYQDGIKLCQTDGPNTWINKYHNNWNRKLYNKSNMMMRMIMQFWSWPMKMLISFASHVAKVIQDTCQNVLMLSIFWRLALSSLEVYRNTVLNIVLLSVYSRSCSLKLPFFGPGCNQSLEHDSLGLVHAAQHKEC